METKFILINSLTESLILNVWDYNDHRKNALLGSSTFELSRLQDDATQEGIESAILKDGKDRGELRYDVSFFPVLKPEDGEDVVDTSTFLGMNQLCYLLTARSCWHRTAYHPSGEGPRRIQVYVWRSQSVGQSLPW